ncbi:MAG: NADH-quinone oxidoreductase subunit N [Armatimonadota bacterium]|nr:NADH-quinone oxidoreductase subunit N [Armatimonadota bacterium]MDR7451480.1 NADH-quinone oxidoreductase subunit N [Armatimonadota bacterium]MDR7467447.1 NADH-quinone oxidoreductase subunit N [Armatimonadota bacterium]MDR7494321.1 NADH-quinone oxidoreductase subunit N [Armatimonadota bacterium]MDR7499138.1 NADH-quinone oxidoreductase subunit N [Armatimonadota bacterium]
MTPAPSDLWAIGPELWLLGLGLLVLLLDLGLPPGRKAWAGGVAAGGLLLALLPIAAMLDWPPRTVFFGTYAVDGFAVFFKIVTVVATALVILASLETLQSRFEGEFYALLVFTALGLVLMAASTDLILLALAIEYVSLTSYVLAGFLKASPKSNEAGIKYFLFGAAASAVMLFGFSIVYGLSGSTNLYDIAGRLRTAPLPALYLGVALMLAGFGFKISMVPFHQWTPDVYEGAPTPVAAFLSVASKAAGFAALVRVLLLAVDPARVDWVLLLSLLAAVTMTLGNLLALPQRNIKRMLAYSSISHAGFILIAVAAFRGHFGTPGLLVYLLGYTFTQLGAFFVAVLIGARLRTDEIPDYAGLARRAPVSSFLMAVFMLSLTGIPPTAVFVGKFYVLAAAIETGLLWLAVVGVVNSVISLFYYVGVIRAMYVLPAPSEAPIPEPPALQVALGLAGLGTLLIGLYPQPLIDLARNATLLLRL